MGWWRKYIEDRKARAVPYQHELKLDELEGRLLHVEDQVRRMRGYVYSKKGLVGPADQAPPDLDAPVAVVEQPLPRARATAPTAETRDELRKRLLAEGRIFPGRPTVHGG